MNFLIRTFERTIIGIITITVIWVIITQIFDRLDQRMPFFIAGVLTYLIAAYFFLPKIIRLTLIILRKNHIPRFTRAADGLAADPVNIVLVGSEESLKKSFLNAGWHTADPLTLKNAWKMIIAFIHKKPYPTAPFSSLYLFGRRQDLEFQQPIGNSPRQRHHIRFWVANIEHEDNYTDIKFWTKKHKTDFNEPIVWIGAATEDIGFGLTRLTFQISHATDKDVDEEREYVINSLQKIKAITQERYIESNHFIAGKYKSDGRIFAANLV